MQARFGSSEAAPRKEEAKQPEKQPKKQPKGQPTGRGRVPMKKNKNLYVRQLTGIVVEGVLRGGTDSRITLRVTIKDSGKKEMKPHYLKERPKEDREQMMGAIRQFMERFDLSAYDRKACERFIELLQT